MTMSVAGAAALALLLTVVSSSQGSPVCQPMQLRETMEIKVMDDRPDSTDTESDVDCISPAESDVDSSSLGESSSSSSSSSMSDSDLAIL